MSNELTLPASFGAPSKHFTGASAANDELGQGVTSSYGILGYKGKVWSIRHAGNEQILMRDDGDGPRNSIEVVLVKASPAISKIYYKSGYVDGSNAAPDCFSSNGVTPDPSVQNKVNPTCADCPMNAWGSRISESGKQNKACSDSRRVAITPLADIDNELFGGPMLLRIPAASLKDLKGYGDVLNSHQYPYFAVATRIAFDPNEAYPKFVFSAIRPLNDDEAAKVLALRDDKRISAVLNESIDPQTAAAQAAAAAPVASSPFEQGGVAPGGNQPVAQTAAQPAAPVAQPQPQTQPQAQPASAQSQPAPQPAQNPFGRTAPAEEVATEQQAPAAQPAQAPAQQTAQAAPTPQQDASVQAAPDSFDDMLDGLLG